MPSDASASRRRQPRRVLIRSAVTVLALGCAVALAGCSGQLVVDTDEAAAAETAAPKVTPTPTSSATPTPTPTPTASPTPTTLPEPEPEPAQQPTTDPRFDTCGEAIAVGYGPYIRGVDPEYDWYRDGDKDGDVCEP